jgi:hypothetical protein
MVSDMIIIDNIYFLYLFLLYISPWFVSQKKISINNLHKRQLPQTTHTKDNSHKKREGASGGTVGSPEYLDL